MVARFRWLVGLGVVSLGVVGFAAATVRPVPDHNCVVAAEPNPFNPPDPVRDQQFQSTLQQDVLNLKDPSAWGGTPGVFDKYRQDLREASDYYKSEEAWNKENDKIIVATAQCAVDKS